MHYYDDEGNPAHTIVGKNGKERTPYWYEAKAKGLAPGTTAMNSQLASDAIVYWKIDIALKLAEKDPFDAMSMVPEVWRKAIKDKLKAEGERITTQGHGIHDALEKYYKTGALNTKYKDFIIPVIELIEKKWPMLTRTDWIAEKRFQYKGIYGGSVDLHTEYNNGIIVDYKSKDTTNLAKFKTYDGHPQQLAAYGYGLKIPKADCHNILVSAHKENILLCIDHDRETLDHSWEQFKILAQYWHLTNYRQTITFD